MVVYNITTKVHFSIDLAWLQWQQEEHIPAIMATGLFTAYRIFRLLEQDDPDGNTYAVQYTADTAAQYQEYLLVFGPVLREKAIKKWGDKTISFRSVLEVIH
ncbi:MAG: DUF4286 family protein [Bacteroidota bacterium]